MAISSVRILLLTHSFNSLAQRLFVVLREHGHDVTVEFEISDATTEESVSLFRPDVVVGPYLKRAIPESVWRMIPCLVVHPGPPGDRGPSALDWAILDDESSWGVTVLQAVAEMDAGPVWASQKLSMRAASKSSLYRHEVADAAERAVLVALDRLAGQRPFRQPSESDDCEVRRPLRAPVRQSDRTIDWSVDTTASVLRKIRSGDGRPGVRDKVCGLPVWVFDGCSGRGLTGEPGAVIARSETAICRATVDGSVWIGHLRRRDAGVDTLKLPATTVLSTYLNNVQQVPADRTTGWGDIWYDEVGRVGILHFPFYNGAMSVRQCQRLRMAWAEARRRPTRVLVLAGGPDFWSNGMNLNVIEAAASPANESWRTINAIDDVVRDIICTTDKFTIAAMQGSAGAGGVFLALAADRVVARASVVLNPHYKSMGNLYGSEYWTYLLPKRVGRTNTDILTQARLPMGVPESLRLGLADASIPGDPTRFLEEVEAMAKDVAADPSFESLLKNKADTRTADEVAKPLEQYRSEELERMRQNFFGFDPSYHVARYNFVQSVPKSRTPHTIALHRRGRSGSGQVRAAP